MNVKFKGMQRVHIKALILRCGNAYSLYLHYVDNAGERVRHALKLRVLSPQGMKTATPYQKKQSRENWELAELLRSQTEQALIQGTYNQVTRHASKERFLTYFDKVTETIQHPKTKAQYLSVRNRLEDFAGSCFTFRDITPQWVESFTNHLLKIRTGRITERISPNTAGTALSRLRAVLRRAVKEGIIHRDPSQGIKTPKSPSSRTYLSREEVERIREYLQTATPREAKSLQPFLFACYTGLRFSDVQGLQWLNIEQTERAGQSVYLLKYQQQKTKRYCVVPLSNRAIEMLGERPDRAKPTDRVFANMLTAPNVNRRLKETAQLLGIPKNLHFHIARHTFAVLSLSKGVDIYSVSHLLGHTNLQTTLIYAKMTDEKLYKAIEILND